ncbi:putative Allergen Asp f 7 like protein, partial [Fusarium oxysporum f. sp. albedinis]
MSETALKGSIVSSPSPSPPPTFPRLGSRPKSIAKQYAAALALASTTDSSVDDLHKITWGQRRFVIASLLDRRKSRETIHLAEIFGVADSVMTRARHDSLMLSRHPRHKL